MNKSRGEAFAVNCHKCIHSQNGQMLRPYTMRQTSLLLEFFKKLKCYKKRTFYFEY
ncbi:hypothetical protein KsCSTR_45130 [Candidatus Kuenenia stuttgartiensis]|uniref:Uncharacterized protein n=1 Tax=Kuenenia stuttgartiensis TaxID=174633 RepID=Q1PWL0_KUEST|nr:hypothetical protein KsCSTR_45130 [Candidatus Kuenenia stuttgartiensis]CAJ71623.1 unknown protein [Candidatus Kuenenia stuttgartiensis]